MTVQIAIESFLQMNLEDRREFLQIAMNYVFSEEDATLTEAQEQELESRFDEIEKGTAVMHSWGDVEKRLKEKYNV